MNQHGNLVHAALVLAAGILTAISSAMAYALPDLGVILALLAGSLLLQLGLWRMKKSGIAADAMVFVTALLEAFALSRILAGRANLMGYVWFSDLESGNPIAVTALWLAVAAMILCVLTELMNVFARAGRTEAYGGSKKNTRKDSDCFPQLQKEERQ